MTISDRIWTHLENRQSLYSIIEQHTSDQGPDNWTGGQLTLYRTAVKIIRIPFHADHTFYTHGWVGGWVGRCELAYVMVILHTCVIDPEITHTYKSVTPM